MSDYDQGDVVRLTGTFRDGSAVLTNTTAVLTLRAPDATVTTPALTNVSAGIYRADVTPAQPGVWYYRWTGTGAVTAEEPGSFTVRRRRVS